MHSPRSKEDSISLEMSQQNSMVSHRDGSQLWRQNDGRKSRITMELPALERTDRGCLRSVFLGSHHVLAFALLAVRMKTCRCASKGNAVRTGPALHKLPCLSQGLRQGVPPSAWKGHRRSHVTQNVNCSILWWSKEPGGDNKPLQARAFVSSEATAAHYSL